MRTLPVESHTFGFVKREKKNGKPVGNRCGRDFLYYALHYKLPEKFSPLNITPEKMEKEGALGLRLPSWLMWTQLQFLFLPRFLKENEITLFINKQQISSFFDFVSAILFSRMSYTKAVALVESVIDREEAVGIDISLGVGGLLDHVMFVYGYDKENFYVCDTHQVPNLEYEKIDTEAYFMKLPKAVIKKRWTLFGRVWELI